MGHLHTFPYTWALAEVRYFVALFVVVVVVEFYLRYKFCRFAGVQLWPLAVYAAWVEVFFWEISENLSTWSSSRSWET